jgi:hypothetical protein
MRWPFFRVTSAKAGPEVGRRQSEFGTAVTCPACKGSDRYSSEVVALRHSKSGGSLRGGIFSISVNESKRHERNSQNGSVMEIKRGPTRVVTRHSAGSETFGSPRAKDQAIGGELPARNAADTSAELMAISTAPVAAARDICSRISWR